MEAGARGSGGPTDAARRAGGSRWLPGGATAAVFAAELHDETVAAWKLYVAATEQRMAAELDDSERFLALDFQEEACAAAPGDAGGRPGHRTVADARRAGASGSRCPRAPSTTGWAPSWCRTRSLDDVVDGLQYDIPPHEMQEDVIESRVLGRDGDTFAALSEGEARSSAVVAEYNTEHAVEYVRPGGGRAWSRSEATRIAEIDDPGSPREREKARSAATAVSCGGLNLYWRYVQVDGGVLVECEALTLSRSIPLLTRWFVSPIINRESRSVLSDTLHAVTEHLGVRGATPRRAETRP